MPCRRALRAVALYPDALLANALSASSYALEVVQADRWLQANKNLKGDQLRAAVDKQAWTAASALASTPIVLATMSEDAAAALRRLAAKGMVGVLGLDAAEIVDPDCEANHSVSLEGKVALVTGPDDFTFPIPLVRDKAGWAFDTRRGPA